MKCACKRPCGSCVGAHTTDVKTAYDRGFKDAMKSAGFTHPNQLLAQSYERWVKESK